MPNAFDTNLMFWSSVAITANTTAGPLTVWGQINKGLAVRIVTKATGADDTILPEVWLSADNSTYYLAATYRKGASKPGVAGTEYIIPFPVAEGKNYVKLELTPTGTTTSFGSTYAGIVPNDGNEWDRTSNWE